MKSGVSPVQGQACALEGDFARHHSGRSCREFVLADLQNGRCARTPHRNISPQVCALLSFSVPINPGPALPPDGAKWCSPHRQRLRRKQRAGKLSYTRLLPGLASFFLEGLLVFVSRWLASSSRALVALVVLATVSGCGSSDETSGSEGTDDTTDSEQSDDGTSTEESDEQEPSEETDSTQAGTDADADQTASETDSEDDAVTDATTDEAELVDNDTTDRERLPESLREACMDLCDAQYTVECAPAGSSIEICDLQCVASVSTQRDFCIEEYTARTRCLADGGFECVNGYPVARSTCAGETVAYTECVQELPCKMYCAELVESGCADDELDCREECIAASADDDLSCQIRQDSYIACMGQLGLTCEDGTVIPHQSCIRQMFDAADCRNDGDTCSTWCEGAEQLGCGMPDCLAECQELSMDPSCGSDYDRMVECGIRYGYVGCTDDGLVTDPDNILCDSDIERYSQCLAQPTQ